MKKNHLLLVLLICSLLLAGCSAPQGENTASTAEVAVKPLPKIQISSASSSTVNQNTPVTFEITYSNAKEVLLNLSHITLATTETAACTKSLSSVEAMKAILTVSNCTGSGNVAFQIAPGSAKNEVGLARSLASASFLVDNSGVTHVNFGTPTGGYSAIPSSIGINFMEVVNAASITAADFTVGGTCGGVTIGSIATSGVTTTVNLTGVGACTLGQTVSLLTSFAGIKDVPGNSGSGSATVTYTLTNTGPTTGTFSPGPVAINLNFSTATLSLPGTIDDTTLTDADFNISGTCAGVSVSQVSVNGAVATITLADISNCTDGQTVVITTDLAGINDAIGFAGVGTVAVTYTIDTNGPSGSFVATSATLASLPHTTNFTLSSDVNFDSVTPAAFSLSGSTCSTAAISDVTHIGSIVTVIFSGEENCQHGETLQVTADLTGVTDVAGNAGAGTSNIIFTLDAQGPMATLSLASAGVATIPVSLTATFDSDTNMNSITAADFVVGGNCGASLASISKTGSIVTLNLSGTGACTNTKLVTVSALFSGVTDTLGNAGIGAEDITLTVDQLGPIASFSSPSGTVSTIPASYEVVMSPDTDMATFSNSDVTISGTCGATLDSISNNDVIATINLNGTNNCNSGETVVISVNQNGVRDVLANAGTGSAGITLTFDNVGPTLTLALSSGAFNPLVSTVTATFSADTDMSTVGAANFNVGGTCGATLDSVTTSGQVATLTLSGTLLCIFGQTIEVTANPMGTLDTIGNPGLNNPTLVVQSFDNIAPTALMLPLGLPVTTMPTAIVVTFSLDTNMATVDVNDFSIGGTCAGTAISSVTKNSNVATVHLTGTAGCGFGRTMTVMTTLNGVEDDAQNAGVGVQGQTYTKL